MMPAGVSPVSAGSGRRGSASGRSSTCQTGRGAGEVSSRDHRHGLGVGQDVRDLALAIQDVDGHEDRRPA